MFSPRHSRPLPTEGPSAGGGGDEFDLLDYEGGEDDPFSENYKAPNKAPAPKDTGSKVGRSGTGLGIDEEVEVTRKPRAPRVKLDEHRLLSAAGIPKLRKKAKDLKFKGKGHEYSDAAKLLAFYQLWLDDLFPKARFLDAIAMVEKMGHKRQMQIARMEWINEGRPKSSVHEDFLFDEPALTVGKNGQQEKAASRVAPIFEKAPTERPKTPIPHAEAERGDLYDATPRAARKQPAQKETQSSIFGGSSVGGSLFGAAKGANVDDGPEEDDLDALLAEQENMLVEIAKPAAASAASKIAPSQDNNFDDEMEAMAEMDDMW